MELVDVLLFVSEVMLLEIPMRVDWRFPRRPIFSHVLTNGIFTSLGDDFIEILLVAGRFATLALGHQLLCVLQRGFDG